MIDSELIVARIGSLPTLPTVVLKLMALLKDPRASASDFEKAVKPDPALTSNLLRTSNSARYHGVTPCTTAAQAISRVGTARVLEVISSAALQRVIPAKIPGYEMTAATFWLHCIAVAVFSERLAREAKFSCVASAFTAGLLHDIGKLVIGEFLAEEGKVVLARLNEPDLTFISAEHAALGTDHGLIGLEIARRWNLPAEIGAVARWHHDPTEETGELVAAVHVANALAHSFGYGTDSGELHRNLSPKAAARLGLRPSQIDAVVSRSFEDIQTLAEQLNDGNQKGNLA